MKASKRLQKACELQGRVNELLDSVSDELNAIAGDNELRVFFKVGMVFVSTILMATTQRFLWVKWIRFYL